jgi:DNA (cytosine-5)-methyltransferase 1
MKYGYTLKNPLRIGTDCSGIEAPIQALLNLGVHFRHMFSSDIDSFCIRSIKANFTPEILFGDPDGPFPNGNILKRDMTNVSNIDLYVCGFPCQPFSSLGNKEGLRDTKGTIFRTCIETIRARNPKFFILENVRGILSNDGGATWCTVWSEIQSLSEQGYNIQWKVLNTKNYGIGQNRDRVYIVGSKHKFVWPEKQPLHTTARDCIDRSDNSQYVTSKRNQKYLASIREDAAFVELQQVQFNPRCRNAHQVAPCVTANTRMWNCQIGRYATCKELMTLQGMRQLRQVVSKTQMKKQIGNSMSVSVVAAIIKSLLAGV